MKRLWPKFLIVLLAVALVWLILHSHAGDSLVSSLMVKLDPSSALIFALVIFCSAFAFYSRRYLTLQGISFLNVVISLLFFAYYYYESFCVSEKDNIRIDLLFICPALLVLLFISLISWLVGTYFKVRYANKANQ